MSDNRTPDVRRALTLLALLLVACKGGGGSECPVGSEGCECTGGGACDPGLDCMGGVCVDTTADTGTDTSSDTATDDATGEVECASDGDCDDSDPCTTDSCDLDYDTCTHEDVDADGDGAYAAGVSGTACGGSDCDDSRDDVYPGAGEDSCVDDLDRNCDGTTGPQLLLGGTPVAVAGQSTMPRLVWTGSEYGATFWSGGATLGFARIAGDGSMLGSPALLASGIDDPATETALAWTGSRYAVAWTESEIRLAFADPAGGSVSSAASLWAIDRKSLEMAWTGSEIAFVWNRIPTGGMVGIHFGRTDAGGAAIGSDVLVAEIADTTGTYEPRALVWSGSGYGLLHDRAGGLGFFGLGPTGSLVAEGDTIGIISMWLKDMVAWTGSEYGVAYYSGGPILLQRLDAAGGVIGAPIEVSPTSPIDDYPSVDWTGTSFVFLYPDESPSVIRYSEVGPTGAVIASHVEVAAANWPPLCTAWNGRDVGVLGGALVFNRVGDCF